MTGLLVNNACHMPDVKIPSAHTSQYLNPSSNLQSVLWKERDSIPPSCLSTPPTPPPPTSARPSNTWQIQSDPTCRLCHIIPCTDTGQIQSDPTCRLCHIIPCTDTVTHIHNCCKSRAIPYTHGTMTLSSPTSAWKSNSIQQPSWSPCLWQSFIDSTYLDCPNYFRSSTITGLD